MAKLPFDLDPKELVPFAVGLGGGLLLMAAFVLLGLAIGLTPSVQFGIPYQ
jgi:hypothetical protein